MPEYHPNSIGTRIRSVRASIGQRIFVSTLGLVIFALGLTSVATLIVISGTTRVLIEEQSREINKQIVFNYERYISSVIETANFIQLAVTTSDVDSERESLDEAFAINAAIKRDVVSIVLFDQQGAPLVGSTVHQRPRDATRGQSWFRAALDQAEIFHFDVGASSNPETPTGEPVITVSRAVSYLYDGRTMTGVLLVELNTESITDLAERTNLGESGHILILDETGAIVYASAADRTVERSIPIARDLFLGGVPARIGAVDMYIHINTLSDTRWRIATVANINSLTDAGRQVVLLIGVIGVVSLALSAVVAGLISVRISRPITQLKDVMAQIEAGDLDADAAVTGQMEIVQLAHSFTRMVERVRGLMDRLVTEQREKRKTELRALQNQINPHFLYNTLDSIVWLAEHDRSEDVVTTVVALAKFFRISISRGETFIPISQELEHVENYLLIQQTRYVDRFTWEIDVEPELCDRRVMKLILQPLVENAIYHGMGDDRGHIAIRGRRDDGAILFEVTNTGYGLTDAQIATIRLAMQSDGDGVGVGLRNVYQRLTLYYGERADVEVESALDESTTIRLIIPDTATDEEIA